MSLPEKINVQIEKARIAQDKLPIDAPDWYFWHGYINANKEVLAEIHALEAHLRIFIRDCCEQCELAEEDCYLAGGGCPPLLKLKQIVDSLATKKEGEQKK